MVSPAWPPATQVMNATIDRIDKHLKDLSDIEAGLSSLVSVWWDDTTRKSHIRDAVESCWQAQEHMDAAWEDAVISRQCEAMLANLNRAYDDVCALDHVLATACKQFLVPGDARDEDEQCLHLVAKHCSSVADQLSDMLAECRGH